MADQGKVIDIKEKKRKLRTVWDGKRLRLESTWGARGEFEREWKLKQKRKRNAIVAVAVILVVSFLFRAVGALFKWF